MSTAMNDWMTGNPERAITIYDLPGLVGIAYGPSFSIKNIIHTFKKPGLWPLNKLAFTEDDFEAAFLTDRPNPENLPDAHSTVPPTPAAPPTPSTSTEILPITPESVRPFPRALLRKRQCGRQPVKSRILTETPEKNKLKML